MSKTWILFRWFKANPDDQSDLISESSIYLISTLTKKFVKKKEKRKFKSNSCSFRNTCLKVVFNFSLNYMYTIRNWQLNNKMFTSLWRKKKLYRSLPSVSSVKNLASLCISSITLSFCIGFSLSLSGSC